MWTENCFDYFGGSFYNQFNVGERAVVRWSEHYHIAIRAVSHSASRQQGDSEFLL